MSEAASGEVELVDAHSCVFKGRPFGVRMLRREITRFAVEPLMLIGMHDQHGKGRKDVTQPPPWNLAGRQPMGDAVNAYR